MKKLFLILWLTCLTSCSNSKKEQIGGKKTAQKSPKLKGLETCNCPAPFDEAEHQLKISYDSNYLKFCSFEYSIIDSTTSEFRIFDKNDSLVFPGDAPFVYEISALMAPLRITQSIEIVFDDSGEVKSWPAVNYLIVEQNGKFKVEEKFVLKPPVMSKQKMDSILAVFKRQPILSGNENNLNPPFATEELEMDLFICALNGNQECLQAFENLEERFVTDGAVAELYSELSDLIQIYKKDLAKR